MLRPTVLQSHLEEAFNLTPAAAQAVIQQVKKELGLRRWQCGSSKLKTLCEEKAKECSVKVLRLPTHMDTSDSCTDKAVDGRRISAPVDLDDSIVGYSCRTKEEMLKQGSGDISVTENSDEYTIEQELKKLPCHGLRADSSSENEATGETSGMSKSQCFADSIDTASQPLVGPPIPGEDDADDSLEKGVTPSQEFRKTCSDSDGPDDASDDASDGSLASGVLMHEIQYAMNEPPEEIFLLQQFLTTQSQTIDRQYKNSLKNYRAYDTDRQERSEKKKRQEAQQAERKKLEMKLNGRPTDSVHDEKNQRGAIDGRADDLGKQEVMKLAERTKGKKKAHGLPEEPKLDPPVIHRDKEELTPYPPMASPTSTQGSLGKLLRKAQSTPGAVDRMTMSSFQSGACNAKEKPAFKGPKAFAREGSLLDLCIEIEEEFEKNKGRADSGSDSLEDEILNLQIEVQKDVDVLQMSNTSCRSDHPSDPSTEDKLFDLGVVLEHDRGNIQEGAIDELIELDPDMSLADFFKKGTSCKGRLDHVTIKSSRSRRTFDVSSSKLSRRKKLPQHAGSQFLPPTELTGDAKMNQPPRRSKGKLPLYEIELPEDEPLENVLNQAAKELQVTRGTKTPAPKSKRKVPFLIVVADSEAEDIESLGSEDVVDIAIRMKQKREASRVSL